MRYFGVVLAVIAIVFISQQNASACFCGSPDVTKAIKDANAIFSAEVVEVSSGRVVFDVEEVWKGRVSGRLTFFRQGSSCDLNFEVGKKYLIYAGKYKEMLTEEDRWFTSSCQGSKSMTDAENDLRRLWRLKLPRQALRFFTETN